MDSRKLSSIFLAIFVARAVAGDTFRDERSSLLQLRESLSSAVNLHSNWTGPPCYLNRSRWFGITCSSNSTVVGITLDGIQLTGTLRRDAFQNVTYLTNLTLSNNALHGDLPSLKGLVGLRVVSFSGNRFSGPIPMEFAMLPELSRLELQDNLLNGTIPLFSQQSLVALNVSHNFLRGSIPSTGVMQRFSGSAYDHNLELCGKPLDKPCAGDSSPPTTSTIVGGSSPTSLSSPIPSSTKPLKLWSALLVAASAFTVTLVVALCFLHCSKTSANKMEITNRSYSRVQVSSNKLETKKARVPRINVELEKDAELEFFGDEEKMVFDMVDLLRSPAEIIAKGRLGFSYKVAVADGPVVVVKRLRDARGLRNKDFVQQMRAIGRIKHENLVEMISFHCSNDEKLVIYEHLPEGSLFQLLHGNKGEGRVALDWASCLNIIKGVAKGLAFLHQSLSSYKLPHGNLKSSNVLLHRQHHHHYYQPKLTDYGFHPLFPSHAYAGRKLAAGKSPEFMHGNKLTQKTDVFCFGLLLVEVITGHVPAEGEGVGLSAWARSVVMKEDILSEGLGAEFPAAEKEGHSWEIIKLTEIALECTAVEPERRPRMSEVAEMIQEMEVVRKEENA